jgi:hypothetical protein
MRKTPLRAIDICHSIFMIFIIIRFSFFSSREFVFLFSLFDLISAGDLPVSKQLFFFL